MNVYDQNGEPLEQYDLEKGYLKEETKIVHHEAVEGVEEQGHWVTIQEYPNGGKDVEWEVDVPGVEAQDAWDEEVDIQVYIPYTPEELSDIEDKKQEEAEQRQFDEAIKEAEVIFVMSQINALSVDDATALRLKPLYPKWTENVFYEKDAKVQNDGRLYKCLQAHSSQIGWEPANVPALWTEIVESHSGSIDDPIPYNNNMVLENGKYYIQDDIKYQCTRDTGIPVYNLLKDLVGIYVEIV